MLEIKDWAALELIAPEIKRWTIFAVLAHPQAIDYLIMSGVVWMNVLIRNPNLSQKCTEDGGWAKMGGYCWSVLLQYQPHFEHICTEHNGWEHFQIRDWNRLLYHFPTFEKYKQQVIYE